MIENNKSYNLILINVYLNLKKFTNKMVYNNNILVGL